MTKDSAQPDVERWVRTFEQARSKYVKLMDAAVGDLEIVLREKGLRGHVHDIRKRVKAVDSFREKIERKNYGDPLNQMRDLVGIRIVCLYPGILAEVDKAVRAAFEVIRWEDKSKGDSPELWRYSSIHYDCCIPDRHSGPQYDAIKGIIFEVQVRTILQDAWAVVEHKLGYKNVASIPDELKREFSALAGLFHIADNSFQAIADQVARSELVARETETELESLLNRVDGRTKVSPKDAVAIHTRIEALESFSGDAIDRSNVKGLLRSLYSDRKPASDYEYSELVEELAEAGLVSLPKLRRLLRDGRDSAAVLEGKRPGFDSGRRLDDVGFSRLVMSTMVPEFRNVRRRRQEPRIRPL